ncbi:MAG TPA: 16S rRNA (cytosine(1402)-N(4))-methyltransferase RsmH [Candidatus Paceibacterota bacterium]|nr:16S rRNA (cytosine(1402)-N(4))-methyltransferase RsmH [Candidatus Paceibacterota bacterium]HMO83088.1 16S rRNA (cytosine(1402)-N(4))-methyltransferase RsmH [Candidatus Paceibacterota bacterium]
MKHITVLQTEAIKGLELKEKDVVVDATYGAGGHAKLICAKLGSKGKYIGIDADATALINGKENLERKGGPEIHLVHDNFANLTAALSSLHINRVDRILADLGWRTDQFTDSNKGFSFNADEPLLMTYGSPEQYLFTAHDIVNSWDEENIADIIYGYGEERNSRRIAKAIVTARERTPIMTSGQLAEIVLQVAPPFARKGKIHPATKTFQALRIAVNDELQKLEQFISASLTTLASDGILAIITFHSLEDRIVKLRFKEAVVNGQYQLLTKKPITASAEELKENPRARSAKLRLIKKL